ncbi:hypothetical protein Dsin_020332 [Dipteronia sinensis]|uniref:Protein kinase domain-containing protein n=1 Tax=Dipteronia sinensis TaxID=43782 RepID=A0AAE0A930_9ROSI|nr:hypothetical protein Dsin_020332 [Dipteronia sinensis]
MDLNGKLGYFGLARLHDHGSNPQTTKLVGTIGYMAQKLPITGMASTSTYVYAFRVLMLEVACGKRPTEKQRFVIDCWRRGAILDASDPRLEGIYADDQMKLVLKLGMFCLHSNPTDRPIMRQVMQYLEGDAKLPDIPFDNVIDFFSATGQSSDLVLFTSFLSSSSTQIMSIIDSIDVEGR